MLTDYERMGSPPPTIRCAGGTIEVDTPEGVHVFEEASGKLLRTRPEFRGRYGDVYSLEICECGHHIDKHTECCTGTHWRLYDDYCPECGEWRGYLDEGYDDPCGCEGFRPGFVKR